METSGLLLQGRCLLIFSEGFLCFWLLAQGKHLTQQPKYASCASGQDIAAELLSLLYICRSIFWSLSHSLALWCNINSQDGLFANMPALVLCYHICGNVKLPQAINIQPTATKKVQWCRRYRKNCDLYPYSVFKQKEDLANVMLDHHLIRLWVWAWLVCMVQLSQAILFLFIFLASLLFYFASFFFWGVFSTDSFLQLF